MDSVVPMRPGQILQGSLFNEPMRVETVRPAGAGTWVAGLVGTKSERFRSVTLTFEQIQSLKITSTIASYDGDGRLLRLGLQAYALGIAWKFDPYFGLSISRVDPLPHQLSAVYDYLLKLPRVRFLLADDAGAGKTIMAGLLIRELKLRGLAGLTVKPVPGVPHCFEPGRTPTALRHHEREPNWKLPQLAARYPRSSTDRETAERHNLEWVAQAEARHSELSVRRERRRRELERQQTVSLQSVERLTSVVVTPHPEREAPDVRRLRPNYETEAAAMRVAMEFERAQGRVVTDVHDKNLGYDITSLDVNSGELRLIEIKGLGAATGRILLTPNERRVAEDRRDCYLLYVVTNCDKQPQLQEPIKDPARIPWHEVIKVQHYWLEVNAMTQPMKVSEPDSSPYGDGNS